MSRLISILLHYKPGPISYIAGGVLLAAAMALVTQYGMKGRIDVSAMIDRDAYLKPFWQRNPRLQYLDSFPRTSFLMVKDTQTGLAALVDTAVVINAELRPASCSVDGARKSGLLPPDAVHLVCFQLVKPDTGAGVAYIGAISFQSSMKDAQLARFYSERFQARGDKVETALNSSRGIILEFEDQRENTVARISIPGSTGASNAFFAWTRDCNHPPN